MGRPRSQLHNILKAITPNVYFQPPNGLALKYPCIVYKVDNADTMFADNKPYSYTERYQVTIMDQSADTVLRFEVAGLPMCLFDRSFATNDLNHYVYNIFF